MTDEEMKKIRDEMAENYKEYSAPYDGYFNSDYIHKNRREILREFLADSFKDGFDAAIKFSKEYNERKKKEREEYLKTLDMASQED